MFGFVGLVLAVPVLAVAAVVYRYFHRVPETAAIPPPAPLFGLLAAAQDDDAQ